MVTCDWSVKGAERFLEQSISEHNELLDNFKLLIAGRAVMAQPTILQSAFRNQIGMH